MYNKLIKISELKLFSWIQSFDSDSCRVMQKCQTAVLFLDESNLETWTIDYFSAYYDFFETLSLFHFCITHVYKDFIVHINYKTYMKPQYKFENSEYLLLYLLDSLYFCWITLLLVLTSVHKSTHKLDTVSLQIYELSILYKTWCGILPVIDELVFLLHKLNSKFIFEHEALMPLGYLPLYINGVLPRLFLDNVFIDLNILNARDKLKLLIKLTLLQNKDLNFFVYLVPDILDFYYTRKSNDELIKERGISEGDYIDSFLDDITSGISYATTKFLIFNPVLNVDLLRNVLFKLLVYIMCFSVSQRYFLGLLIQFFLCLVSAACLFFL